MQLVNYFVLYTDRSANSCRLFIQVAELRRLKFNAWTASFTYARFQRSCVCVFFFLFVHPISVESARGFLSTLFFSLEFCVATKHDFAMYISAIGAPRKWVVLPKWQNSMLFVSTRSHATAQVTLDTDWRRTSVGWTTQAGPIFNVNFSVLMSF